MKTTQDVVTQQQALDAVEVLRDHIPMPWESTEAAVKLLQDFIARATTQEK